LGLIPVFEDHSELSSGRSRPYVHRRFKDHSELGSGRSRSYVHRRFKDHSELGSGRSRSYVHRSTPVGTVVVLTFWDISRIVAVKSEVIKDGTFWAPTDGGVFAFFADVEGTAVIRLHVSGVVQDVAIGVELSSVGAAETIRKYLYTGTTSGPNAGVFPLAGTGEFIEDKAGGAIPRDSNTIDTLVVFMADRRILVLEVAILTGALNAAGLRVL